MNFGMKESANSNIFTFHLPALEGGLLRGGYCCRFRRPALFSRSCTTVMSITLA